MDSLLFIYVVVIAYLRRVIFPVICLVVGIVQVIIGFAGKSKKEWRRLQGMVLMTAAVIISAFFPISTAVQVVLLISGAVMVIIIVILQMYWWKLFKQLCGNNPSNEDLHPENEPQQDGEEEEKEPIEEMSEIPQDHLRVVVQV